MAFRCCRKRYEPHEDLDVEDVENQYRAGRKESLNLPKDFPMYVISVEDFLELDEMRPHQELKEEKLVRIFEHSMGPVTFISHEWSGLSHPDPGRKQLLALKKTLWGFRSHSHKFAYDPVALMRQYHKTLSYKDLHELTKGWLWIDFFSIPQEGACRTPEEVACQQEDLKDAIRSLHTYVAHSSFFFILAPVQHHEMGRLMDFSSWKSRGWCQFELTVNVLMGAKPVILVQGLGSVKKVSARIFLHFAPCLAKFTREEDKLHISDALDQVINAQVQRLRSQGEVHRLQMLECLRSLLTRRAEHLTLFKRLSRTGSLAYMASRDKCIIYSGWTQLHYAAARSDVESVTRLLGICEEVDAQTQQADKDLFLGSMLQPMHMWAAFSFSEDIIHLLLDAGAQVDCRAKDGNLTPLMLSCRFGNLTSCRELLKMQADPNAEDDMGCRPLTFALANDAEQLVKPLLMARADPHFTWGGLSSLHFLGLTSSANSLELLLQQGLDINMSCRVRYFSRTGLYVTLGMLRNRTLRQLFWLADGSTPILAAAALGNAKVVQTLKASGADISATNAAGKDLAQICRISCIPEEAFTPYRLTHATPLANADPVLLE